jgi:putative membrane protein
MMGPGMMGPGMMGSYSGAPQGDAGQWTGGWGFGMALGMLAMVAFWAAVIVAIVLLVRAFVGTSAAAAPTHGADEPLTVLRRRYAAGEIDEATYERMKHELAA